MKPSHRRPVFAHVPGRPDLKRFVGFEGDAHLKKSGTMVLPKIPRVVGARLSGLGALGVADRHNLFPASDGTPGNLFQGEYDEYDTWGTANPPATALVTAPTDPAVAIPAPDNTPQQIDTGLTVPFGISIVKWRNPTTMQSVPIIASTPSNTPVLSLNMERNSLLIQNNSTATSPDVPPNFYIGFNAQPQQGLSLALQPLSGILFDIITPRDAIYVLIAGGSGVSQVVQGVVVQGTYAPL